jgi:branched-chain amino acid transport system ATP-binding protein
VLTVRDLTVRFGGNVALSGVNLELAARDVIGVIGPNGAGKTTLLNAVSGLLGAARTGTILLDGQDVSAWPAARLARAGVGRGFQDPHLIDALTVFDNVMCGAHDRLSHGALAQIFRLRAVARAESRAAARVGEVLRLTGLEQLADATTSSLPYGKRKLVDIARALVREPSLLLLDEPTSGLDRAEQERMRELLSRLRAAATMTIILVEHHMDVVRKTCDHVVGMQAGTVLMTGTPADVLDSDDFRAAIVGASP